MKWKKEKEIDAQPLHTPLPSNYWVHTAVSINPLVRAFVIYGRTSDCVSTPEAKVPTADSGYLRKKCTEVKYKEKGIADISRVHWRISNH